MDDERTYELEQKLIALQHSLDRQTRATNRATDNATNWKHLAETRHLNDAHNVDLHKGCDRIIADLNNKLETLEARLAACTCQEPAHDA